MNAHIRNIAIIAHIDHGKTTIIDSMLKASGTLQESQKLEERIMDSNQLEKERGITILAKCTTINIGKYKINIIDTPGHADFGGEVERIMSMVEGVLLLVDSVEGPMPQTKFVLSKALKLGLKPIVVINKMDKKEAKPAEVIDKIFDLFISLNANDEQLEFPILYAAGRSGWCSESPAEQTKSLEPLFNKIIQHVPPPRTDDSSSFSMLVTLMEADKFLGRILIGKIHSGSAHLNMTVQALDTQGQTIERGQLTKLYTFLGTSRKPIEKAEAGDIIAIAGMKKASVAHTITDLSTNKPIAAIPIDPPIISITIGINDSPFAGQEGDKVTSRMIRERLMAEAISNVAITVQELPNKDAYEVSGRGELQLGILIENMRREGFELSVSRPKVVLRKDENGNVSEPVEEVIVEVDEEYGGAVIAKLNARRGEVQDMQPIENGKTRIVCMIPSRGMFGYYNEFLTDTRGTGIMSRAFYGYKPYSGELSARRGGVLISKNQGVAVAYALFKLQDRGIMFVKPQNKVYPGMIVGEHNRENDLEVNVSKTKQLTNVRASGTDEAIRLSLPRVMSLEEMITYISEDELVEVTPKSLRLRKKT